MSHLIITVVFNALAFHISDFLVHESRGSPATQRVDLFIHTQSRALSERTSTLQMRSYSSEASLHATSRRIRDQKHPENSGTFPSGTHPFQHIYIQSDGRHPETILAREYSFHFHLYAKRSLWWGFTLACDALVFNIKERLCARDVLHNVIQSNQHRDLTHLSTSS